MIESVLSSSEIAKESGALILASGATRISRDRYPAWPPGAVAYEDKYSLVAVWPFETYPELLDSWLQAQQHVLDLIGQAFAVDEPKSWDGYLILVTSAQGPEEDSASVASIRSDTRRLRKIVVTQSDLPQIAHDAISLRSSLRSLLAPVLALSFDDKAQRVDPFSGLAERLSLDEMAGANLVAVLEAYREGRPVMQALHDRLKGLEDTEGRML